MLDGDQLAGSPRQTFRWDVTRDVRSANSGHNDPHRGFVAHSSFEDVHAEHDQKCLSRITNVRLRLDYSVLHERVARVVARTP